MLHRLKDGEFTNMTVLVRVDYNVPMKDGEVLDPSRIDRTIPTIRYLLDHHAKVVIISHMGRPKGQVMPEYSLKPLVPLLEERFNCKVHFAADCVPPIATHQINQANFGDIVLLENLRFYKEETDNDPVFAEQLASLGAKYVNDAFACSHRQHASVVGIGNFMKHRFAGFLIEDELIALDSALIHPMHPVCAMVGGSKVSTKIDLLMNLISKMDVIMIGGAMANTFLKAQGYEMGASYLEDDWCGKAKEIMESAAANDCRIILPKDAVIAPNLDGSTTPETVLIEDIPENQMMLDVGPRTVEEMGEALESCATVIWNGPFGAFEVKPFDEGSKALALKIAELTQKGTLKKSIAGGGDVVAAIAKAGATEGFTYISTAGGAFLEWMEGKELPALPLLEIDAE